MKYCCSPTVKRFWPPIFYSPQKFSGYATVSAQRWHAYNLPSLIDILMVDIEKQGIKQQNVPETSTLHLF